VTQTGLSISFVFFEKYAIVTRGFAIKERLPCFTVFLAGVWTQLRKFVTFGRLDYTGSIVGGLDDVSGFAI
jgi:hypothetical protein